MYVSVNYAITASDNGSSLDRRQAIICNNAGILSFETFATNFSKILTKIWRFSFTKMHLIMLSAKWWPFCLDLNVLLWNVAIRYINSLLALGKLGFNHKNNAHSSSFIISTMGSQGLYHYLIHEQKYWCNYCHYKFVFMTTYSAISDDKYIKFVQLLACHMYSTKPLPGRTLI